MRFALYAGESDADKRLGGSVALAAAALPRHSLTRVVDKPRLSRGKPPFPPTVQYALSWEDLLTDAEVDAVIVTGVGEDRQQTVRQLVQAGKAVLVSPVLMQPAAFFYEMALVEAEAPGTLFPLMGVRSHPSIAKLRALIAQDGLGRLRHAQLDRKIAAASAADAFFSNTDLSLALLDDADLLRCLCGEYDQVTAMRSGDAAHGFSLATVTFAGSAAPQAVWTGSAVAGEGEWRLTLTGDAGTAVLAGDSDRVDLQLILALRGQTATTERCADDPGPWLLKTFVESMSRRAESDTPAGSSRASDDRFVAVHDDERADVQTIERRGTTSLWEELARTVELVDAVERSVRRRRTIDVHFDTPSERGIFKTQMTAVGCSLLVLTLMAVVVYLGLGAAIALPNLLNNVLVALIFTPLGVFLILQLLVFVARPATRDGR
jgi:myo-inositol 2-dehydrogenase/D-chiro-inositol 1-dehydrogenase